MPEEQNYWRFFQSKVHEITTTFGYERIDTPIFEDSRLFVRGIGEVTDIVEKETYTFQDRGDDLLTLRPEGTAPVCRAYLEHGMYNMPQPVRLYYTCPVFRYERPQSGRYRQHHQFGIEVYGDSDASIDAEIIEVGWRFLELVGLTKLCLNINSIGDADCRPSYIDALRNFYQPLYPSLCSDCKRRLDHNPLRLLDCKQEVCQPLISQAPISVEFLCPPCREHWTNLLAYLSKIGLDYNIDHRLVRGFDYYNRTVFEITPPIDGRMNTLVGGGRYDGLIQELGGRSIPGVGYGMGMERVISSLKQQNVAIPVDSGIKVLISHMGETGKMEAVKLSSTMRQFGITAITGPVGRGLRSQFRYASSIKATHVVIIGEDEIQKGVVQVRDLLKSEQKEIQPDQLINELKEIS